MPDINITVAHKVAVSDTQSIVCDNSDYTVHWTLDEEWAAYDTKTMRTIYMDGTYTDTVFNGDVIALPVCTVPGVVQIGLFAGNLRTSRVAILRTLPSVRSAAGAPADPTPDVYDQLMELIKGLGGADPEAIKTAVAEYLAAHPIEETDPTVPAWAKAETKPTYTAVEVGAVAQTDLQAATDAALAQAKSSGEFDGAPGENGADGAPGIYYGTTQPTGDTRPVWIDPDGGPDDGGLLPAVTAADNGKALRVVGGAWSPVDMPSGGGETWELIRDFTLAEDVVQVTINSDENGKPFRLKKAYVFITATAPTDESITYTADICFSPAKESPNVWGVHRVYVGTSPAFGKPTRYAMSLWDTYGGIFAPVEIKSSFGDTTADRLVSKTSYDVAGAILTNNNGLGFLQSPCESFSFGSYRKTLFTGANIKIYGVRA